MRTDGCEGARWNGTIVINNVTNVNEMEKPFILFQLSFLYYALLGAAIVFLVGYPVSLCTGGYVVTDERLFTPFRRTRSSKGEPVVYGTDWEMKKFLEGI